MQAWQPLLDQITYQHQQDIQALQLNFEKKLEPLRAYLASESTALEKQVAESTTPKKEAIVPNLNLEGSPSSPRVEDTNASDDLHETGASSPGWSPRSLESADTAASQLGIILAAAPLQNLVAKSSSMISHTGLCKDQNKVLWHNVESVQNHRESTRRHDVRGLVKDLMNAKGWLGSFKEKKQNKFQRCVSSSYFEVVCALAILFNTTLLGVRTDRAAQAIGSELPMPTVFIVCDRFFTVWFIAELSLRWTAEGLIRFFFSPNCRWNMFDLFVVSLDVVGTCIEVAAGVQYGDLSNLGAMRMARVFRVARVMRIIKLVAICREFRMMALSICRSGMSLVWSIVLLGLIMYVFSIYLMNIVTQATLEQGYTETTGKLKTYFGSLGRSMYSLFIAISGGISWYEICDPLIDLDWSHGIVMCFFVFFTSFVMLNIITGIFVNTAIISAQHDDDEVIQEEVGSESSLIRQLERMFNEADDAGAGVITLEQFEGILTDTRTHALMASLGLDMSEASSMFSLMDLDLSGHVSLEEFLVGCMRMRGGAKAVDLVTMMYENKTMMAKIGMFHEYVMQEFKRLDYFELSVEQILKSINKEAVETRTALTDDSLSDARRFVSQSSLLNVHYRRSASKERRGPIHL